MDNCAHPYVVWFFTCMFFQFMKVIKQIPGLNTSRAQQFDPKAVFFYYRGSATENI